MGVSGDKVYYDSGKDVYKAQILSEFAVEGNLDGVDIIADDILITGHMQKAANGAISSLILMKRKMSANMSLCALSIRMEKSFLRT